MAIEKINIPEDTGGQAPNGDAEPNESDIRAQAIAAATKDEKPAEPAAPADPPATDPKDSGLDNNRLALTIARLEKQNREQKAAYEKHKEEYDSLVNALKDPEKRYELLENQFGATYQDWTERLISGNKPQRDQRDIELDQLKQNFQQLQERFEQKSQSEQRAAQEQSNEKAKAYAREYLETNKEKYPVLHAMGRHDLLINEAIARSKEGLPINDDEIAAEVEKASIQTIKSELSVLAQLDAFTSILSEMGFQKIAQRVPETKQTQRDTKGGYEPQTLTNDLSGKPSSGFDYINATEDELRDHARNEAKKAREAYRRSQAE